MSSAARPAHRPLLIGITGPIGCGKSTVAAILGELGGTIIDADLLARRATEPGRITLAQIRDRFGGSVFAPGGDFDRAAMARIVFDDPAALADLERIVHPEVRAMVEQELDAAAADDVPFVVIEAIKLVEGGLAERCDEVWIVGCSPPTQRERLTSRGVSEEDAAQRIAAQGSDLGGRLASALIASPGVGPRVRHLSTEGPMVDTGERAEDLLAEAFEAGIRT